MKQFFLLILLVLQFGAQAQTKGTKYFFEKVGMTYVLPEGYAPQSKEEDAAMMQKGMDMIEKTSGIEVSTEGLVDLLSAAKDEYNYINITLSPYNTKADGPYNISFQKTTEILFNSLKESAPAATIDSASSMRLIDGKKFYVFEMNASINKQKLFNMQIISNVINGRDLAICIVSVNEAERNSLEQSIAQIRFKP